MTKTSPMSAVLRTRVRPGTAVVSPAAVSASEGPCNRAPSALSTILASAGSARRATPSLPSRTKKMGRRALPAGTGGAAWPPAADGLVPAAGAGVAPGATVAGVVPAASSCAGPTVTADSGETALQAATVNRTTLPAVTRLRRARLRSFRVTPRSYQPCWGRTYIRATMFALGYRSVTDPRETSRRASRPLRSVVGRRQAAWTSATSSTSLHCALSWASRSVAPASSSAFRRAMAAIASSWFHGRPWGWPASMASRV